MATFFAKVSRVMEAMGAPPQTDLPLGLFQLIDHLYEAGFAASAWTCAAVVGASRL